MNKGYREIDESQGKTYKLPINIFKHVEIENIPT